MRKAGIIVEASMLLLLIFAVVFFFSMSGDDEGPGRRLEEPEPEPPVKPVLEPEVKDTLAGAA